jgi:hypothetical protein
MLRPAWGIFLIFAFKFKKAFDETRGFEAFIASPNDGVCFVSLLCGGIAQLGEHLICIQKVAGSIPVASTIFAFRQIWARDGDTQSSSPFLFQKIL